MQLVKRLYINQETKPEIEKQFAANGRTVEWWCHVGWTPCHHGMARPQVADEVLQLRRVAASIFSKQSRTADKGWSSSLEVGRGANNPSPSNIFIVTKCFKAPRTWTYSLARPKQWKKDMRSGT
jgi:hypothetical protein